jgi:hypothetical protein
VESSRLAGVGEERPRQRDPENAAELLGGMHGVSATMQKADAIESLNGWRQQGEEIVEEHTVLLVVARCAQNRHGSWHR